MGFLRREHPAGNSFHHEVSIELLETRSACVSTLSNKRRRLVAMEASLSIHQQHCILLMQDIHNVGIAAAHGKPPDGLDAYKSARRLHRRAGSPKHDALYTSTLSTDAAIGCDRSAFPVVFNTEAAPFVP
jgi:hypothetical protein